MTLNKMLVENLKNNKLGTSLSQVMKRNMVKTPGNSLPHKKLTDPGAVPEHGLVVREGNAPGRLEKASHSAISMQRRIGGKSMEGLMVQFQKQS